MNLPTILIGAAVLAIFVAVVVRLILDHKNGRGACSCGDCASCGGCAARRDEAKDKAGKK